MQVRVLLGLQEKKRHLTGPLFLFKSHFKRLELWHYRLVFRIEPVVDPLTYVRRIAHYKQLQRCLSFMERRLEMLYVIHYKAMAQVKLLSPFL